MNTQAAQKCWINVTYTAPTVVDTRATENVFATKAAIWTGNKGTSNLTDCGNWEEGKMPGNIEFNCFINASPMPVFNGNVR